MGHLVAAAVILAVYGCVAGFVALVWQQLRDLWANRLATSIDGLLARLAAGYESTYLRTAQNHHLDFDPGGLSNFGEKSPQIRDVFVDVSLLPRPPRQVPPGVIAETEAASKPSADQDTRRGPIWQFLQDRDSTPVKLALIGAPGSGKTTLLRHIVLNPRARGYVTAKRKRNIPVLLFLRECFAPINFDVSLPELVSQQVEAFGKKAPTGWWEQRLNSGRCIVMFDGLDEVQQQEDRQAILEWIQRQASRYSDNDYIVTSRPHGYWEYPFKGATALQVCQFTYDQVQAFVHRWFQASERPLLGLATDRANRKAAESAEDLLSEVAKIPALAQLSANPLLLTMIVQVHRHRGKLPGTRPELYAEVCEVLLERRQREKNLAELLPPGQKLAVLSQLAYTMVSRSQTTIRKQRAQDAIKAPLALVSTAITPGDLLASARVSGLLLESERGDYSFVHDTFREYLAADCISKPSQLKTLLNNVANPSWRETILFYAAMKGAGRIVRACLDSDELTTLALAFECADVDKDLDNGLRDQLKELLAEATNPAVHADRRRLAAAIRAAKELRSTSQLANGARMCDAPVSRDLFEVFRIQSRAQRPARRHGNVSRQAGDSAAATGIQDSDATAFLTWLNGLFTGQNATLAGPKNFRLPNQEEAADSLFHRNLAARNCCVWLSPRDDSTELDLWVPREHPHPYAVSSSELRVLIEADLDVFHGQPLAIVLALALAHALAFTETLSVVREESRTRPGVQRRADDLRDYLEQACELARRLVHEVMPAKGRTRVTNRALTSALDLVVARALPQDFARAVSRDIAEALALSADRADELTFDLARARANDVATGLRLVVDRAIDGEFLAEVSVPAPRPGRKSRDLAAAGGSVLAAALDDSFLEALSLNTQIQNDFTLPMCLLSAREFPADRSPRNVIDLIWSPGFDALAEQHDGRIVLPTSLVRLVTEAQAEIIEACAGVRAANASCFSAMAERIRQLTTTATEHSDQISPADISYVRLGAVGLAASLIRRHGKTELARKYLDVATGITALERRIVGESTLSESMILMHD